MESKRGDFFSVDTSVLVWGVSNATDYSQVKVMKLADLEEMLNKVKASNEKYNTNESITVMVIYELDDKGREKSFYVIAEIYDFDSEGRATSVNDAIFRTYNG